MEARVVFDQQHVMFSSCIYISCKRLEYLPVCRKCDFRNEPIMAFSCFWTHKRIKIRPFVRCIDRSEQWLADRCPKGSKCRMKPDAMLIQCPKTYFLMEKLRRAELLRQRFPLNSSFAFSSPRIWTERGRFWENPAPFRYSYARPG